MCGIAGIISKNNERSYAKEIQAMINSIAHRGPDDEGTYINDNVALGHRRLSILDISTAGHQPMTNKDKTLWLTYNGEIYNYLEIKKEIGGTDYASSSDTEVLLKAYEKWGPSFVKRLNGIFAFAIWDDIKKELFCARDHVGVKPFYYAQKNGVFYFGSEAKALLAAGFPAQANDEIIYEYLSYGYYHHSEETFFKGVYKLLPGHTLTLKNGSVCVSRYWNPAESGYNMNGWSLERVSEEFLNLFENTIAIQLRSDVPVAIQSSGGFDSSAVTAMVNRVIGGQKNFNLFSFFYDGHNDGEVPYMKALASHLGWDQDFVPLPSSGMSQLMEKVTWHQDEPFPGLPTFGLHMLGAACREKSIPVVLGGQGGDEVGGGYEYYMGAFLLDTLKDNDADYALKELDDFGKLHCFSGDSENLKFLTRVLSSYMRSGSSADGTKFTKQDVLNKDFLKKAHVPRKLPEKPFDSELANMQYRDIFYTKLPRMLHCVDRAAMAYGIEQRVPFLDYRLVEFGLAASAYHKISGGHQKYFMRKAFEKILPEYVGKAPKRPVPSPQREWFRKELQQWVYSILSSKSFGERPYFDQKKVIEEFNLYCGAQRNSNSFHIWQWIHLESWLRTFID